jgi:hypothetical protein
VTLSGEPVIFRAMAGDLRRPVERCERFVEVAATGSGLRRVKAVSAMFWRLARFVAGGRACCRFEPGNSRKPPLAGDFRSEFPDFVADFPAPAMHCDKYVCLLQQLPERSPLRGNYDNFGIALV